MPARPSEHCEGLERAGPPAAAHCTPRAPRRPAFRTPRLRPLPGPHPPCMPHSRPGLAPRSAVTDGSVTAPHCRTLRGALSPERERSTVPWLRGAWASGPAGPTVGAPSALFRGGGEWGLSDKPGARGKVGGGGGRAARGGAGRCRDCQHLGGGAAQGKAVGAGRSSGRAPKELSRLCTRSLSVPVTCPAQPPPGTASW